MHSILHVIGVRWWSALAAYSVDLAEAQARAGDRVAIVALEGSPSQREARARGLEVAATFGPDPWHQAALLRKLRASLADRAFAILHAHTGSVHLAAELARRSFSFPALVRTRGDIRPPRSGRLNRWLYRQADAVTLSAAFLADSMAPMGLDPERVDVVHAAVDTKRFAPQRLESREEARVHLGLETGGVLVGIAGRLSPVKGHDHALSALAMTRVPDVSLVISGEESQITRAMLERRAEELGVRPRVHFIDRVSDVTRLLAAIDVGLVASTGSEAICRIAGEMMACARPIIVSNVSVLPEMVRDGEEGVVVPPGDPRAIAAAIDALATDPARAARMGEAGRRRTLACFSPSGRRDAYARIYERALERRRAR